MAVQTQIQTRRGTAATWTSTNPTLAAGEIGFETDTGKFKIGTGSASWTSLAYAGGTTAVTYLFNATSGQTTFSGADANSLTLAYTVGAEQVYLNGVLLVRGTDYTATNGTSIVLASGAVASDVLNVIAYSTMTLTDAYTQAQANATFQLNSTGFLAGKNKIINGDFSINQRNFSSNTSNATYMFDRWFSDFSGGTVTFTPQTFTLGAAPVSGYESTNYMQVAISGQSGSNYASFSQRIENVRTFAGQTVTVSFWAKAASGTPSIQPRLFQRMGTGGSPSADVVTDVTAKAISTSWVRYSWTFNLPSLSGLTLGTNGNSSLELELMLSWGGGAGINNTTFSVWGVQLEAGSVATAFQTATGTVQGELAACQRYYQRVTATTDAPLGFGIATSSTVAAIYLPLPVTMRTTPSVSATNVTSYYATNFSTYPALTALALYVGTPNYLRLSATVASGLSTGTSWWVGATNANPLTELSAEL